MQSKLCHIELFMQKVISHEMTKEKKDDVNKLLQAMFGEWQNLDESTFGWYKQILFDTSTVIAQTEAEEMCDCLDFEIVVLANGQALDLMSDFKKDNTGYHLKHLFIGSEGTLGVLTKLAILCFPVPKSVHVAFLGLSSYEDVMTTLLNAKKYLGEILSACEVLDSSALEASVKTFDLNSPVKGFPFYMLIESSGSEAEHDLEKFNKFLEYGISKNFIQDGTISGEPGKIKELWKLRELVPVAVINDGFCFKYDVSIPLSDFFKVVETVRDRVGPLATFVSGYGHLGDSNLHLNVACKEYNQELYERLEPFVFDLIASLNGSVSAEHGIGFLKRNYLRYSKDEAAIKMMRDIKRLLDPNGILNPYKVLS